MSRFFFCRLKNLFSSLLSERTILHIALFSSTRPHFIMQTDQCLHTQPRYALSFAALHQAERSQSNSPLPLLISPFTPSASPAVYTPPTTASSTTASPLIFSSTLSSSPTQLQGPAGHGWEHILGNLYRSLISGIKHICDSNCDQLVWNNTNACFVCSVSGRVVTRGNPYLSYAPIHR
jgi:hypothetical protein